MAAKTKVAPKGKNKGAAKKATVQKAKPKGLQLSTAQRKAFNTAFSATATAMRRKQAFNRAVRRFRNYRQASAYANIKKYNIARSSVRAAAIAYNATRMSWVQSKIGHQNAALQTRIEQNMFRHVTLLGRAQYVRGGEKAYMHAAIMRTVTMKQAISHEHAVFNRINRIAKRAARSTRKTGPRTAGSAAITKAATAAGLKAAHNPRAVAAAVRASNKAAKLKAAKTKAAKAKAAKSRGARVAASKQSQVKANAKAGHRGNSASKKAPVKTAKKRTAAFSYLAAAIAASHANVGIEPEVNDSGPMWYGDEYTPNCVVIAIANHLKFIRGITVTRGAIRELTEACAPEPSIEEVLWEVYSSGWPYQGDAYLADYSPADTAEYANLIIGFEVMTDEGLRDHAALAIDQDQVISWGSVMLRKEPVEEAWNLQWKAKKDCGPPEE